MLEIWRVRVRWRSSQGLICDLLMHSHNSYTYTILPSSFIQWHYVVVSYWQIIFHSVSITTQMYIFACADRHLCTHISTYVHTLHADFLFPSQLTHTIHTKCPLPLYMNNTNVFRSSPPSWKIRSVREPLTLARGYTSMWQWNRERSNIERVCVCVLMQMF